MPRVLVVDDEVSILDTLQILLRGEGFEVATAKSGREALERVEETSPDVVLTDIRTPGVTGLALLAQIRERDPETPGILMTAQATLPPAPQAGNQGALAPP